MTAISLNTLPDPELAKRAAHNRRSVADKLRIIRDADACAHGQLGALLRKEGIYSSTLLSYRKQLEEGKLAENPRARSVQKRREAAAKRQHLARRNEKLEKENRKLKALIELQKKVAELFQSTMEQTDNF